MTLNLNELEDICRAATPGVWKAAKYSSMMGTLISFGDIGNGENIAAVMPQKDTRQGIGNGVFISTFNPTQCLSLLQELRVLRKALEIAAEDPRIENTSGYEAEEWIEVASGLLSMEAARLAFEGYER